MKFCIVTTFYPPYNFGGDGWHAYHLANALARSGHKVTVLHSRTAYQVLSGNKAKQSYTNHPRVAVHSVDTPFGILGLLAVHQTGKPCLQKSALKQYLSEPFDVIHYNNVSLLGGVGVFSYGNAIKLCTLTDHWLVCPMHILWKWNREICTKQECLRCTLHGGKPPQLWRYSKFLEKQAKHIDAFTGPTMSTMRHHKNFGFSGKMVQLPLFCPIPQLKEGEEKPLLPHQKFFLCVGRLEKYKGFQTVIPLFKEKEKVSLVICGDGSYKDELQSMACGMNNVHFAGEISQAQLMFFYRSALATIIPSLCYETFCNIVAESFAVGTPVIANSHSSLEEIISTYGGGILYRSTKELHQAISQIEANSSFREELGQQGHKTYTEEFSEQAHIKKYLGLVSSLKKPIKLRKSPTALIKS